MKEMPDTKWFGLRTAWFEVATTVLLVVVALPSTGRSQEIDSSRGVDPTVDYESLVQIGPWDDRNYQLTAEDLALLAENESELRDPIPVFYRVLLRRKNPALPRSGAAQYPRSALPGFFQLCGGYLVNNRYYRNATVVDGRFLVIVDSSDDKGIPASDRPECQLRRESAED
jgi:hypothetical protein